MPVNTNTQNIDTFVVDGGWLLRQNKWVKGETWLDIIDGYVQLVKHRSKHANNVIVFDGYESSTKDHTHRRRKKHFCHDMKINRENTPYTSKEKFLSNSNKTELISKLAVLEIANAITVCCRDDADTAIVRCLQHSLIGTVEVRAEDADILIMLVHHYDQEKHHFISHDFEQELLHQGNCPKSDVRTKTISFFATLLQDVILYPPSMGPARRNCMKDFALEILVR